MKSFRICVGILIITILPLSADAKERWTARKTRHFIIYYQTAPQNFIDQVEKAAEEEYAEISDAMGVHRMKTWTLDNRAEIYIYNDNIHYLESAREVGWSHGVADPKDKVIRSFPSAHGFFDSTLPHEMAHIMFRELIGYEVQVPWWLEEGVAMYYEKGQRFGADQTVKSAMDNGSFIPLEELSQKAPRAKDSLEEVSFLYLEAASVVRFMINEMGGEHKFKMFCEKMEQTRSFNQALGSIYTRQKDLHGLSKAWKSFLEDLET